MKERYNGRNLKELLRDFKKLPRVGGNIGTQVSYKGRSYIQLGSKRYLPTSKSYRNAMASQDRGEKRAIAQVLQQHPEAVQEMRDTEMARIDAGGELTAQFQQLDNAEVDFIEVNLDTISARDAINLGRSIVKKRALLVMLPDSHTVYTLSERVTARLLAALDDLTDPDNLVVKLDSEDFWKLTASDRELIGEVTDNKSIIFKAQDFPKKKSGKKRQKPAGGFFKYLHTTEFDWSRLGIFKTVRRGDYDENCLWLALKAGGFPETCSEDLKICMETRDVPECKLKIICAKFDICIKLTNSEMKVHWHGNKKNPIYHLGLVDEHYFALEKVAVTSYCLEHYDEVKDETDFHRIIGKNQKGSYKREDRFITSFQLFKTLLEQREKLLKPIPYDTDVMTTQYYKKVQDIRILEVNPKNVRPTEVKGSRIDLDALDKHPVEVDAERPNGKLVTWMKDHGFDVYMSKNPSRRPETWWASLGAMAKHTVFLKSAAEARKVKGVGPVVQQILEVAPWDTFEPESDKPLVHRFVIDFETTTEGEKHLPYLCNIRYSETLHKTFYGLDCAEQALDWAVKKYWFWTGCKAEWKDGPKMVIMAHNLAYDLRFMLERIICTGILPKNNKILQATGMRMIYGENVAITFKDTLSLIPKPLKEWGECFKLAVEKEVMPYKLYTQENVQKRWCPVVEAVRVLEEADSSPEDIEHFLTVLREKRLVKGYDFDILAYSAYYCERDTDVTLKGYMTFREWVLKAMNVDTDECITTTSISKAVTKRSGCFDGVMEVSGNIREFIQKCVVGGRVMTRENKPVHAKGVIEDFDGVSLYPSALNRMDGFLKGTPKVLEDDQKNMEFLNSVDGYFVKVKVTAVKTHRAFPLISIVNQAGIRDFTNNLEGQEVYLDKVGAEDAMKFQGVEFKILQGLYFNEGRNDTIKKVIRSLFEMRLRRKAEGTPIQEVYKLIMNVAYGFTIQKAPEFEFLVKTDKELETFVPFNYNFIHSVTNIGGHKNMVKKYKAIDQFFNHAHVGVEVLSMSKRIMNEVMCTAEDHGVNIFYQDTDSTHLFRKDVPKLQKAFKDKYDRELIGKNLGQFHGDFDLKGAKDVRSTEFIGLGKKCYLDTLKGVGKNGEEMEGLHIRMKGVPTSCVKYTAKELGQSVRDLYMDMFEGKRVTFDLTQNGKAAKFDMRKDMTVRTKESGEFTRNLQFNKARVQSLVFQE